VRDDIGLADVVARSLVQPIRHISGCAVPVPGNIFVVEWVQTGRVTLLRHVA
jgi:hypothetical protein